MLDIILHFIDMYVTCQNAYSLLRDHRPMTFIEIASFYVIVFLRHAIKGFVQIYETNFQVGITNEKMSYFFTSYKLFNSHELYCT